MITTLRRLFKNPIFNVGLIVVLSVLVFYITISSNGKQILSMISNSHKGVLLGIALMLVFERIVDGWGLMMEARVFHKEYRLRDGFVNAYTAAVFNNITPSASGGQFAQVYIFRRQGLSLSNAIGVLWLDFIIYQSTMALFVFLLLVLRFGYFYGKYSQFFIIVLFGFMVNSAVIVALWAMIKFPRFYHWLTTKGLELGNKLHIVKGIERTKEKIDKQLDRFDQEVKLLHTNKGMILGVAFSNLFRLIMIYSVPFLVAYALHIPLKPSLWLDTVALSSFVAMVNAFVPLPGSSGGSEATFVLMFSTIFGGVHARTIMLLWRFMTYYFQTIMGAIIFVYAKSRPL